MLLPSPRTDRRTDGTDRRTDWTDREGEGDTETRPVF